ncbi:pyridoxal 5'-phosphate synthase glutaminase subunit PdxT [Microbacterium halophytorum]|uniref:pyridoxal 5'-phosphate synthase glutaminase subunit PdxT n=1 Tax=Microbacterium halophytorum TaxID=2067568 RepID=UPI001E4FE87E
MLESLGAAAVAVKSPDDLSRVDGLVLPGGESTAIDRLARVLGVRGPIVAAIAGGLPVFGTCAGMILLADRIDGGAAGQRTFGGIDATVRRNAFGRQADSFEADVDVAALGGAPVRAAFIRAPAAVEAGPNVTVLATVRGMAIAVERGPLLATAFHPEHTGESRFHARFLDRVRAAAR